LREPAAWRAGTEAGDFVPEPKKLKEWCNERIGTVHTFQGKEEEIVWMVLGCDETMPGAVNWACAKPNLLNVALTRAKHRVFLIGDRGLWGEKPYFDQASAELAALSAPAFIARCGGALAA